MLSWRRLSERQKKRKEISGSFSLFVSSVSLEKRKEGKRIGADIGYLALFDGKGCLRFSLLCGVIIRFGGKTTLYLCTWSLRCYFCTVSADSVAS